MFSLYFEKALKTLFIFLILIALIVPAQALERRRDQFGKDFGYFIYPIATEIPGLGKASGGGASVLNMFGTDADFTGFSLKGDFDASGYTLLDFHLIPKTLILDIGTYNFRVASKSYRRGIESDPDKFSFFEVEGDNQVLQTTFTAWDRMFELYFRKSQGGVKLLHVFDEDQREFENINQERQNTEKSAYGMTFDWTDDRLDPRKGIRLEAIHNVPRIDEEYRSEFTVTDYNLQIYLPLGQINTLALNYYRSDARITRQATTDFNELKNKIGLNCTNLPSAGQANCLETETQIINEQIAENQYGNATPIGGTQRLRSYPNGRYFAGHSLFYGAEFRWNLNDVRKPFNIGIAKGVQTGFQIAFFAEKGGVADEIKDLQKNMKSSYGVGFRMLLSGVIFRVDLANGEEGATTQMFINYPWSLFSVDTGG